jgi:hypothetical protein
MLSTAQFLMGLEREGVIRNAYDILDRVTGARGLEIRNPHLHATPGAEEGVDDWSEYFTP